MTAPVLGPGLFFAIWPWKHLARPPEGISKLLQKFKQCQNGHFISLGF
jgi:hypothetical protein